MRCVWLMMLGTPVLLSAAAQQTGTSPLPTFALPKATWVEQTGKAVPVSDRAVLRTLQKVSRCGACTPVRSTSVWLGALGRGSLLSLTNQSCGATGNCPFILVVHHDPTVRVFPVGYGWSFAFAPSFTGVPDVFTQANMSCCDGIIQRFSYLHGHFQQTGCDAVDGALVGTKRIGGPPNGNESTETSQLKITHC